jgi:hypothetical protein
MKVAVFKTLMCSRLFLENFVSDHVARNGFRDRVAVIYMVRSCPISIYTVHKQDFKERSGNRLRIGVSDDILSETSFWRASHAF